MRMMWNLLRSVLFYAAVMSILFLAQPGMGEDQIEKDPVPPETVKVSSVRVTGNVLISTEEILREVTPYIGLELDLPFLRGIADVITDLYQKKVSSSPGPISPSRPSKTG